jgi:REP-associated tyrosine transposase
MGRPRRDNAPGLFHVTVKALGPGPYFLDAVDKLLWRTTLARTLVRTADDWTCISYCEMTTHVHLIVETLRPSLSVGMRRLNREYTRAFNGRHSRKGPLLTRRFHAVRILSDVQLAVAFRYDARNPAAAGLCRSPVDWPDGSYRSAAGLENDSGLTDPSRVIGLFGTDREAAVAALRAFVEWPIATSRAA